MRLHVKVDGKGTPEDPWRVNLPHYTMIGLVDEQERTVVVEVPDYTLPEERPEHDLERTNHPEAGEVVHASSQRFIKEAYAHMDDMYREHAGEYRIKLVKSNG